LNRIRESLATFAKNPWGLGVGKAGLVSLRFPDGGVLINESWHLQILVELGLVGFLVYAGVIFDFFRKLYVKIKSATGQFQRTFIYASLAILAAIIIHGFFLHTWTDISLTIIVWIIIGIAINISTKEVREG
jgi:O-antigen ligase